MPELLRIAKMPDDIIVPVESDLVEAKKLNKYLFIAIEDLNKEIMPSLINGQGTVSFSDPKYVILKKEIRKLEFYDLTSFTSKL